MKVQKIQKEKLRKKELCIIKEGSRLSGRKTAKGVKGDVQNLKSRKKKSSSRGGKV